MSISVPNYEPDPFSVLPKILKNLAGVKESLNKTGFLYIPPLPENLNWLKLAELITGCTLIKQENGQYTYTVKPLATSADRHHSQSSNEVKPHNDDAFRPQPARYVALRGITPASCGGGLTQLLDVRPFLRFKLTEKEQTHLMLSKYKFSSNDGKKSVLAPVLEFPELPQLRFRFSYNNLLYGDPSPSIGQKPCPPNPLIEEICQRLLEDFRENHISFRIEKDGILLFDNWLTLHGRTAFDDPSRHLLRIWLA